MSFRVLASLLYLVETAIRISLRFYRMYQRRIGTRRSRDAAKTKHFKVSKSRTAVFDDSTDASQLRWVEAQFIYFLDIPWDYEMQQKLSELDDTSTESNRREEGSGAADLSTRAITIGLLEDLMDMQIPDENLLLYNQSGARVLSGDRLSRLVVPWARGLCAVNSSTNALHNEYGQYNRGRLRGTTVALDDAVYSKTGSLIDDGPDSDMLCAIATMFTSLENCIQAIWPSSVDEETVERTRMFGEVTQILRQKLASRWGSQASYEMERLLSAGIPFAAFATAYDRTATNTSSVDTENYEPRHIIPTCTCPFVKPGLLDICERVSRNEVPIVVLDGTNLQVRSARDVPYMAISHVWADGLGSTTEEGLPRCQVERLSNLANKLVPGGAFWQDGLCIPGDKQCRKLAIALMAETYADAAKVLVLDEGLRTSCGVSAPKEECLMRMATSGWMQRIWTLQEGMLGQELYFELKDDLIDCTHFNGSSFAMASKVLPILEYRRGNTSTLTYKPQLAGKPKCTVNELIGLLRYRTTSHALDEPVAVSGLLGVDTRALVNLDTAEERMRALLIQARELPRQLAVFGWLSVRSSLPNFGWAPLSISEILWPGNHDDPYKAICTEDGLFGDFTVVRFPPVEFPEMIGIILIVTNQHQQAQGGTGSDIYNLVLSPHFFRFPQRNNEVGGFLMKGAALPESMREEAVGAVVFPSHLEEVAHPDDGKPTLACKWVAPASVRVGLPDRVETSRSRYAWSVVYATIEPLRKVRVT